MPEILESLRFLFRHRLELEPAAAGTWYLAPA